MSTIGCQENSDNDILIRLENSKNRRFVDEYFMNVKLLEMQKPDSNHLMGLRVLGIRC